MPELPEVETIKRQLEKILSGKTIKAVFVYKDKMVKVGAGKISNIKTGSKKLSRGFAAKLKGAKVLAVARRAKYLIFKLSKGNYLLIHLRMSGQLIYVFKKDLKKPLKLSLAKNAAAELLPGKHTFVEFVLSGGDKLFYNDPRQFGHLRFVNQREFAEVFDRHQLGPEPLAMKFPEFKELLRRFSNRRAKDFLLDQSAIAGIGNIYADESLYLAKIHPLRKIHSLREKDAAFLFSSIQKVLNKAIKYGGSSIEHFLMTNGKAGKYSEEHLVYGKKGKKCGRCGAVLKALKVASRTSTFCPQCQKLTRPFG